MAAAIAISFVIGSLLALIPYYVPLLRFAIERRIGPFLNSFSAILLSSLSSNFLTACSAGLRYSPTTPQHEQAVG